MFGEKQTSDNTTSPFMRRGGGGHYECMQACWDCSYECKQTLYTHCLAMGGKHVDESHVKVMTDCIQICQTVGDFLARESELHTSVCVACAEICEACAQSCTEVGGEEMEHCAETCRDCARSCREAAEMQLPM